MTLTAGDVKARAAELGFVACGITDLAPSIRAPALTRWLEKGYGGNMRYLNRQAKKRKDPRLIDRDATRTVVILDNYYYQETEVDPDSPRTARYSRSTDYHISTYSRINQLAEFLVDHGARTARPYVDTGPVPERELAERAGLGWIGKNTMLIRPGLGSWFVIGSIFTDLPLEIDQPLNTDHCGSCTKCLDACPTSAFIEPYVLDATRCISYLTIEYKSEIPAELAGQFGGWAFGCDICNEVCPWNLRFAAESTVPEFRPRGDLREAGEDFFERMTEVEFQAKFADTPLARPGLARMRRNWRLAWASLRGAQRRAATERQ
ncbi:MAG TPA: tRNA epoxyqueuosine(34) reductase QueG [Gemmatimonadales bacterium]|nr:tRNA epoxyqueuosine(34) reductase QueG [Gemmatimonadales bacterium]HRZ09074.1 tRNA epoxyqueuosine(34) reductase QueG [Gemmatimonadales bacterium]